MVRKYFFQTIIFLILGQSVSSGLVCTYASCSDSNPCSTGSCNNGYCCSSSSSQASPKVIVIPNQQSSSTCNGCNSNTNTMMISYCPGGGQSSGPCNSGYCGQGYSCVNNNCCPTASAPATITIQRCPNGQASAGYCNNGGCSSGYSCNSASNLCCAIVTATFVCSDGTQAAGGCVSGQCGSGYTCKSGLCCAETTDSVKCLDGTIAIGACINGNCGAGFVCTTGNICCPAVSASVCNKGGKSVGPCVNGYCPRGMYCDDLDGVGEGNCCTTSPITCSSTENIGQCIGGICPEGHICDTDNEWCCPTYDTVATNQVGPCVEADDPTLPSCPNGFICGLGNFCYAPSDYKADCYASESIGPCTILGDTRECPTDYTCSGYDVNAGTSGYCCPNTVVMRARRRHPGRKVESFLSQVLMNDNVRGDIEASAVEKLAN
ncbi:Cysteine-rich repeat-containing protein [Strongyloides ratti]|uniref:Cysteine-rich repeat-containing protein n=1 Tax=Strongyloides ratti TaxID=34506 RepID=A0A090LG05_STRRB|nr:Cysteine-rich repeat-containing protein [Strongyloides ratti]CEF67083.1 Cysteine-rich repeat-containing protein [Strongyloides ratti]